MAYTSYFRPDESYSASDVNKAFSKLTTQGVSLFNVSGDGTLIDINDAIANWTGEGVELYNPNACKVEITGKWSSKISEGTLFLPNGMMVVFDENGHDLPYLYGNSGTYYVGVKYGIVNNDIQIVFLKNPANDPTEDTSVIWLGKMVVTLQGGIVAVDDLRTWATTKLAPATQNVVVQKNSVTLPVLEGSETHIIDFGWAGFNWIKMTIGAEVFFADLVPVWRPLGEHWSVRRASATPTEVIFREQSQAQPSPQAVVDLEVR